MAYTKTLWKDRIVQFANKFTKSGETSTEVTLTPAPGTVTEAGTPLSAANMNKIEQGIEDAHNEKVAKAGDTITGDLIAKWIGFESGDHWITNNDGGGNFNIRVGHKWNGTSAQAEYTSDGGGAIHLNFAHENSNPYVQISISEDPTGKFAGETVTWVSTWLIKSDGTITWNGNKVYHAGNLASDQIRKTNVSTSAPSGGSDGDVWLKY